MIELDLNAAQHLQAIYTLNFLHREKHTSILMLLQVSESLYIFTHFVLLQYDVTMHLFN